ncbi:MAG: hypothetical protein RLZZ324_472 [Candidatus Parcubacteria bacterium]|jgi:hypothetical protein
MRQRRKMEKDRLRVRLENLRGSWHDVISADAAISGCGAIERLAQYAPMNLNTRQLKPSVPHRRNPEG